MLSFKEPGQSYRGQVEVAALSPGPLISPQSDPHVPHTMNGLVDLKEGLVLLRDLEVVYT